jgi:hypothetical protein
MAIAFLVVFVLYFLPFSVFTLVKGRSLAVLPSAAAIYAIYGASLALALLVFVVPIQRIPTVVRVGRPLTVPVAILVAFVPIVVLSLAFRDGGDPSTLIEFARYWRRNAVQSFLAFSPFWLASFAFVVFQPRTHRS